MSPRFVVVLLAAGLLALAAVGSAEDAVVKSRTDERSASDFLRTLHHSAVRRATKDQSFNIGGVYQYDRQLATRTVYKSSSFLSVNKEYLSFSSSATIHCIQVVDSLKTGKNAEVTVQNGGIGQRSVNIRFKSQRGEKISYVVIIWGQ